MINTNNNNLYITYNVSGMQVCVDNASTVDDITLEFSEIIPAKPHTIIGHVEITRIPSDLRQINFERVEGGYGMMNAMSNERDSKADVIAQEMNLEDPVKTEPYIQGLMNNDLYVIKNIKVIKCGQGYGSYILKQLPKVLKRITNDRRPVIAVVPNSKKATDVERVIHFFELNDFKKVHACAQTRYFY